MIVSDHDFDRILVVQQNPQVRDIHPPSSPSPSFLPPSLFQIMILFGGWTDQTTWAQFFPSAEGKRLQFRLCFSAVNAVNLVKIVNVSDMLTRVFQTNAAPASLPPIFEYILLSFRAFLLPCPRIYMKIDKRQILHASTRERIKSTGSWLGKMCFEYFLKQKLELPKNIALLLGKVAV